MPFIPWNLQISVHVMPNQQHHVMFTCLPKYCHKYRSLPRDTIWFYILNVKYSLSLTKKNYFCFLNKLHSYSAWHLCTNIGTRQRIFQDTEMCAAASIINKRRDALTVRLATKLEQRNRRKPFCKVYWFRMPRS